MRRPLHSAGGTVEKHCLHRRNCIGRLAQGRSPAVEKRCLTVDERVGDALFTGLRLDRGIDVRGINARYGVDIWRKYGADLEPFD